MPEKKVFRSEDVKDEKKKEPVQKTPEVVDTRARQNDEEIAESLVDLYNKLDLVAQHIASHARVINQLNEEISKITGDLMRITQANENAHTTMATAIDNIIGALPVALRQGIEDYMIERGLVIEEIEEQAEPEEPKEEKKSKK
jgi:hypothetical protein